MQSPYPRHAKSTSSQRDCSVLLVGFGAGVLHAQGAWRDPSAIFLLSGHGDTGHVFDDFAPLLAKHTAAIGSSLLLVEHVGSTSVPGLAAKPIIDILAVLRWGAADPFLLMRNSSK
jgi:hypothetical protein